MTQRTIPLRLVLMVLMNAAVIAASSVAQERDADRRPSSKPSEPADSEASQDGSDADRRGDPGDQGKESEASASDGEQDDRPSDGESAGNQELPAPPAPPTENTVVDFGDQPDQVTFTFREAPWPDVLEQFADWAGLSLDLTDTPPGYFNYYDNQPHTPAEAIDVLNGYLLPRGYVVLRRDQFLAVLETDNEMLGRLIPTIERGELSERGDNELVRMVVPVDKISPATAAQEVEGLLGPYGSVTPVESSQSLVLVGFGSTLRQVLAILDDAVPPLTDDKLEFRSFALEHLPASEAENQIRTLFGLDSPKRPQNVSGARREVDRAAYYRNRARRRGGDRGKDDKREPPPMPLMQKVAMNMQVSALDRTNSLLVTATPEGLTLIEGMLQSIDVPQSDGAAKIASSDEPYLKVYRLGSADEEEVAKTIDVLMPGMVVNEDRRQDTIHIYGTDREHQEVQDLIQRLDDGGIDGRTVEVVQLRQANPYAMEELLSGMFDNEDRDNRPIIQADPQTRTLVIRGSEAQVAQVRSALAAYGEGDGASRRSSGASSRFRRIQIGGRSAERIAEAARAILAADDEFENSVRVVVPGQQTNDADNRAPERTTRRPGDNGDNGERRTRVRSESVGAKDFTIVGPKQVAPDAAVPATAASPDEADRTERFRPVSLTADVEPQPQTGTGGTESSDRDDADPSEPSRVQIEARGDELYLYGGGPAALGEVEATIRDLMQQMPERKNWTIFYLRVAEANEVAMRLYDLVEEENFLSPYPEPVDPDQPPLEIVPDQRTNSLFVSGPDHKIDQIERLLEYLDAVDTPQSYRDRQPHTILVEHADVNDVAEMLRSLYKDYLTDPAAEARRRDGDENRRRRSRDDDRRDSRRGGGGGQGSEVKLALAVDERTNELIVSCDEPLFQEIEALVRQRDQAVSDSQPTVQMLPIGTASTPAEMAEILQGMSTKIEAQVIESDEEDNGRRRRRRRRGRN